MSALYQNLAAQMAAKKPQPKPNPYPPKPGAAGGDPAAAPPPPPVPPPQAGSYLQFSQPPQQMGGSQPIPLAGGAGPQMGGTPAGLGMAAQGSNMQTAGGGIATQNGTTPWTATLTPGSGNSRMFNHGLEPNLPSMTDMNDIQAQAADAEREENSINNPEGSGYLQDYLDTIFGENGAGSFDPTKKGIEENRDAALEAYYEQMASRGMGASGAEGAGSMDIYRKFAQDEAVAQQEFQQQQINNMKDAAAYMFQDKWKNMDYQQQEAMARLMYELQMAAQLGEDWRSDPSKNQGLMQAAALLGELFKGEGSDWLQEMLDRAFGPGTYESLYGEPSKKQQREGEKWAADRREGWNTAMRNVPGL
jgi:hypothetical protein